MMSACAGTDRRTGTSEGRMATSSWGALLSFGLGLGTALLGVAAKYVMDYRLARRRLEMDERAAITDYAFPQILPQRLDELLSSVPRP